MQKGAAFVIKLSICVMVLIGTDLVHAQPFYFGSDLSYVNEMEDCGAVYTQDGEAQNIFGLFAVQGANLIRLRLWHTPSWYDQLNAGKRYSDLDDVRHAILRAKTAGLQVLLDFHLSDTWADPGHQVVPAAWADVVDDQNVLADSLRNYIYQTLISLGQENLLPDIVQIGNETNRGILLSQEVNDQGWTLDWQRNVVLFQAASTAIDLVSQELSVPIRKAIHIADPGDVAWFTDQFVTNGFNNFDIIGISYYWQWHQPVTIPQVGQIVGSLKEDYPDKDVMIFEAAYGWTTQNADGANNLLFNAHPSYAPLSPVNQKKWMVDLTQAVIDHGGSGVIYWEPAWVSTDCETPWVTGSSWDNATFFDFDHGLMADGGIGWMSHPYDFSTSVSHEHPTLGRFDFAYADGEVIIWNSGKQELESPFTLSLYSTDGRRIFSGRMQSDNERGIRVPVPGLTSGFYIVSIVDSDQQNYTGKVVITNR